LSAHVLISGTLFRAPESRVSKSGRNFVVATMRCKDGDGSQWWKIVCFSESGCAELLRLSDGDAVSCQGAFKAETYTKDGETRLSLSCIADAVLPLRAAPRHREPKAEAGTPRRRDNAERLAHAGTGDASPGLDDEVPF
jgi:single-stranded DNA-binding protein